MVCWLLFFLQFRKIFAHSKTETAAAAGVVTAMFVAIAVMVPLLAGIFLATLTWVAFPDIDRASGFIAGAAVGVVGVFLYFVALKKDSDKQRRQAEQQPPYPPPYYYYNPNRWSIKYEIDELIAKHQPPKPAPVVQKPDEYYIPPPPKEESK